MDQTKENAVLISSNNKQKLRMSDGNKGVRVYHAHGQTNCQAAVKNMSDTKNKQKSVKLLQAPEWNKRFTTLQLTTSVSMADSLTKSAIKLLQR